MGEGEREAKHALSILHIAPGVLSFKSETLYAVVTGDGEMKVNFVNSFYENRLLFQRGVSLIKLDFVVCTQTLIQQQLVTSSLRRQMAIINFSDLALVTDVADSEMSYIELTEQELESIVGGTLSATRGVRTGRGILC